MTCFLVLIAYAAKNVPRLIAYLCSTPTGSLPSFLCSTLGASSEERLTRDPAKLRLVRWEVEDFTELVAEKLKVIFGPCIACTSMH